MCVSAGVDVGMGVGVVVSLASFLSSGCRMLVLKLAKGRDPGQLFQTSPELCPSLPPPVGVRPACVLSRFST